MSNLDNNCELESRRKRNKRRMKYLLILAIVKRQSRRDTFRNKLKQEGRQRRDRNLIRDALHDPEESTWQCCYSSGDDGVLITITGFDHETFQFIHSLFEPLYSRYTSWCSKQGGIDGVNYRCIAARR